MEDHGVTSITELSTEVSFCSKSRFFGHVCDIRREPFCEHELGRDHPECQRCNGQSPPQPPCFRYALKSYVDIDQCCSDVFNVTNLEEQETHLKHEDQPSDPKVMPKNISTSNQSPLTILAGKLKDHQDNVRKGIQITFTVNDCRTSAFHTPPGRSPRTSFDPFKVCCGSFHYCEVEVVHGRPSIGRRPYSVSTVSGVGSLLRPSGQTRRAPSCPVGHCKRPSLARPGQVIFVLLWPIFFIFFGQVICCQLIRSRWGNARIAVCPNSCDWPRDEQEQPPIWVLLFLCKFE